jgi:small redox-active disulfide protein 2
MEIKVLGTGCAKCKNLEKLTIEAVAKADIDANVIKVEDITDILAYGVLVTPALVIDGKVVVKGRIPSLDEIIKIISAH